jgi:SLT domain-containing protein
VNPMAVLGQHASGLWQMLPSTFAAFGGMGSLFNPILEGIAALKYIAATYGSPFNIPGLFSGGYRGYATGGIISEPIFGLGLRTGMHYGFGENGIRERVTPLGHGGAGGGDVYNIYPPDSATDPDAYGLAVIKAIRGYKLRHGVGTLGIA